MYVCVIEFLCVFVCRFVCVLCMSVCACSFVCVYACKHVFMHAFMRVCTFARLIFNLSDIITNCIFLMSQITQSRCFDVCINRASSVASRTALLHSWTFASIAGGVASGIDVCMHRAALLHALTFASVARGISSRTQPASKCSGFAKHLQKKVALSVPCFSGSK